MPKKVTYGVTGLIDWNAIINVGKARLCVHFTGGALTKYGVTPAEFTTTDPTTQRIIEDSHYYRSGKIKTLRSVGKADVKPLSRKCSLESSKAFQDAVLPLDESSKTFQEAVLPLDDCKNPSADTHTQTIKVACIEDAIDYMREHHNISSITIRTPESLKAVAAQFGIKFDIDHEA